MHKLQNISLADVREGGGIAECPPPLNTPLKSVVCTLLKNVVENLFKQVLSKVNPMELGL